MEFSKRQLIAFGGGLLLLLGTFLPVVSLPFAGSISVFNSGRIDGYALLALIVASLVLAFLNHIKPLQITAILSTALVSFGFIHTVYTVNHMKSSVSKKLEGNMFSGMAEAMTNSVQIQYGWVFLFVGCAILLYSVFSKNISGEQLSAPVKEIELPIPVEVPKLVNRPQTKLVADDMFLHNAGKFIDNPEDLKDCTFCAEKIRITAIKCKHCGSMLEEFK